jgi:nitrite reductase (NO-forming)
MTRDIKTLAAAAGLACAAAFGPAQAAEVPAAAIVRAPTDLPPPVARDKPQTVKVHLTTAEREGRLDDGTIFQYWTFGGRVPGPMIRVRVGDSVELALSNAEGSLMPHNIDLHAVTGPGGGAEATLVQPGETAAFRFKALKPGLYVYHCATPTVAQHIARGMYGLILVEPKGGLPKVDREFYVMQGEIYTEQPFGTSGEATESYEKLIDERPEYYVFNGAVGALTDQAPLKAGAGETIRLYFGVGGPNKTASFHVVGEIFDRVYPMADLVGPPLRDVQTVTVAPGGAMVAELTAEVPGTYMLVDHALSRVERGLVGHLVIDGPANPKVFQPLDPDQLSER